MTPMPHQQNIVEEVKKRNLNKVLLNWGLGTGKTLAGKLIADMWNDEACLVVCPKSLIKMWVNFLTSETGGPVTDLTKPTFKEKPNGRAHGWYVINYDLLWQKSRRWIFGDDYHACFFKYSSVILDESSYIKNTSISYDPKNFAKVKTSSRAEAAIKLGSMASHLCMLSGSPCGGKWEKMYTHMFLLGRWMRTDDYTKSFLNTHDMPSSQKIPNSDLPAYTYKALDKRNPYKMDNITSILIPDLEERGMFTLKTEDCINLPSTTETKIVIDRPKEYKLFETTGNVKTEDCQLMDTNISAARQALRRLASSYNPSKLSAMEDILNSTDERVVVFYNFRDDYEKLEKLCNALDKPIVTVNGDRNDLKKDNNKYETKDNSVCLIQWQSGGYGLNLQKARIEVFFSLTDSYELFQQAKGRILRKGQEKPVLYYYLISQHTIDEKILNCLQKGESYDMQKFKEDYPKYAGLPDVPNTESEEKKMNLIDKTKEATIQPSLFDDLFSAEPPHSKRGGRSR